MKTEKELEIKLKILKKSDLPPECFDDFVGKLQKTLGGKNNKHGISVFSEPLKALETSYFDTKNMDLRNAKIAYRVRSDEDGKVATVKTDMPKDNKASAILAERLEQTAKVSENTSPDNFIEIFKDTEVLNMLKPVIGRKNLTMLFTTKFDRKSYLIERKDMYKILLSIDSGEIIANGETSDIFEIELELIEGEIQEIFNIAFFISNLVAVNAETTSKYVRGLVLSGKVSPKSVNKLSPVKKYKIPESMENFENSVKMAVSHILDNLIYYKFAVETHQSDYEAVHCFRVMLRHLITISDLAKQLINNKDFKEIRRLLKIALKKSSKTRETDIFLHSWKDFLDSLNEIADYNEIIIANKLSAIIAAHRQYQRAVFQSEINDGKFTSLQLLIEKWLYSTKISEKDKKFKESQIIDENNKTDEISIQTKDVLTKFINQKHDLISELSEHGKSLKPNKLHKIRLAVKEKRYILKYFNIELSEDELSRQTEDLKDKQDALGYLNDIIFNLDYSEKILPSCSITDSYRKWLKKTQLSLYKSFETDMEIING